MLKLITLFLQAFYNIDSDYSSHVDNWIQNFDSSANTQTFSFKVSEGQNSSWESHGFEETKVHVSASLGWFISANFDLDKTKTTSHISAADAKQDISVTITTHGNGVFAINPGKWNADISSFKLGTKDLDPILSKPAVRVEKVFLAYGVSMDIDLESSLATQVHDMVHEAQNIGGDASISFFGLRIGGGASNSTSSTVTFDDIKFGESGTQIHIPADNSAFPTLLAVLGHKLENPTTS